MVETRQSTLQRIQVGLVGLVIVLLFVSLASMVIDRVADGPSLVDTGGAEVGSIDATRADAPAEPLAELGVTPVANEGEATVGTASNSNDNRRSTDQRR